MLVNNKFLRRSETAALIDLLNTNKRIEIDLWNRQVEIEILIDCDNQGFKTYGVSQENEQEYSQIKHDRTQTQQRINKIAAELERRSKSTFGYYDYIANKKGKLLEQAKRTKASEKFKRLKIEPEKPASTVEEIIQRLNVGGDRGEEAKIFLLRNFKNKLQNNTITETGLLNVLNNSLNYVNPEDRDRVKKEFIERIISIGIKILSDDKKEINSKLEYARTLICQAIQLRKLNNFDEALELENEARQIRKELRRI